MLGDAELNQIILSDRHLKKRLYIMNEIFLALKTIEKSSLLFSIEIIFEKQK
jgi:hypothetical protein